MRECVSRAIVRVCVPVCAVLFAWHCRHVTLHWFVLCQVADVHPWSHGGTDRPWFLDAYYGTGEGVAAQADGSHARQPAASPSSPVPGGVNDSVVSEAPTGGGGGGGGDEDDDDEFGDVASIVDGDGFVGSGCVPSAALHRSLWELGLQAELQRRSRRRRHGDVSKRLLAKMIT